MTANLEAVARNMKRKFGTKVQVPQPLLELTRKHVLVMSFLPGRTLVAAVQDELAAVIRAGGVFISKQKRPIREQKRPTLARPR